MSESIAAVARGKGKRDDRRAVWSLVPGMTTPCFRDWDDVVAFALSLPDAAMASFYGQPAPKVNGKAFVSQGREPGSFHVPSPHDEKAFLLETDPGTFWQTAHYQGWPGLLVRFGSADAERVALVITSAWWDKASRAQRKAFGERP